MKLLNLGCGDTRPSTSEWTNLDDLHSVFRSIGPSADAARDRVNAESNYVNFDVLSGPLPFGDDTFDGVLASHFFEHFDAQQGLKLMVECRRILQPGGVLLVSVPDASYFRRVYPEDRNENWPRLFDTTDPKNPIPTFFEAALWFNEHLMQFTEDALWCFFVRAGFQIAASVESEVLAPMCALLNRRIFSLEMVGIKP